MATSIEPVQAKLPKATRRAVAVYEPKNGRALAVFDKPGNVMPYLEVGKQIKHAEFQTSLFEHSAKFVRFATKQREKWLPLFGPANATSLALDKLDNRGVVGRDVAIDMLTAMLGAFGAKGDREVMLGMLDMLESGTIGETTEMWLPVRVSPVGLALACRQLIATSIHVPRAAELHQACRKAESTIGEAIGRSEDLVDFVRRCDALLLQFDHAAWEAPYLTPQYRPILERMLDLHRIYGDGSEDFRYVDVPNVFRQAVERERAKLEAALAPPVEPKRLAAANKRSEAKRSSRAR
jgi:hypothetical protein